MPPDEAAVEAAYDRMDEFAGDIKERAAVKYDRVLFVSDNGAARKDGYQPTHYNRPFYSVDLPVGLDRPNLREFHDLILGWVADEPHPAVIDA